MKSFAKRESLMGERGSLNSRSSWEIGAVICGNALLLWFCRPLFCYLLAKYYTRLFINDNDLFKYLKVIKKLEIRPFNTVEWILKWGKLTTRELQSEKNGWFFSHDQTRYLNPVKYAQKVSFIIVPHAFETLNN